MLASWESNNISLSIEGDIHMKDTFKEVFYVIDQYNYWNE